MPYKKHVGKLCSLPAIPRHLDRDPQLITREYVVLGKECNYYA